MANKFLKVSGINSNDNCIFCNNEIETLEHLFWRCQKVQNFWIAIKDEMELSTGFRLDLSEMLVLLGSKDGSNCELVNTIVNICKRHIYVCRCNGTKCNTKLLCNCLIRDHFKVAKILLKETNRSDTVLFKKWGPLLDYLCKKK